MEDAESGSPGVPENYQTLLSPTGFTMPEGINNNGSIAGQDGSLQAGFLLNSGNYVPFILPDYAESTIFGLNDDVELAGWYFTEATPPAPQTQSFILEIPH